VQIWQALFFLKSNISENALGPGGRGMAGTYASEAAPALPGGHKGRAMPGPPVDFNSPYRHKKNFAKSISPCGYWTYGFHHFRRVY